MAASHHHNDRTARQRSSMSHSRTTFILWASAVTISVLILTVLFWNHFPSRASTQTQSPLLLSDSSPEPIALAIANDAPCAAGQSFVERALTARQETHLKLDLSQPDKAAFVSLIVPSNEFAFLTDGTIKRASELSNGDTVKMTGDKIASVTAVEQRQYNPQHVKSDTNGNVLSRVIGKSERWTETMLYLYTADDVIKTTPEHPFFVEGQWIEAQYLQPGQRIHTQSGTTIAVERTETRHDPQIVYSLLIEGTHNFYVGKEGLLAHNCTPGLKKLKRGIENETIVKAATPLEAYAQARTLAKEFASLGDDTIDFVQKIGPNKGRITGRQSPDKLRGWRIDFDEEKKIFHINWWDRRGSTKNSDSLYGAIKIADATEDTYMQILEHFPYR